MLSRNPFKFNNSHETCNQAKIESIFGSDTHVLISADDIKDEIANDEILCQLIKFAHQVWPESVSNELKPYFNVRSELSVYNDCLMRIDCVVFPCSIALEAGYQI